MIVIPKKKALVLRLREPGRVLNVIPTAKKVRIKGQDFVAVPHKLDEVKVLRNLGFDAPSPIKYYYNWPAAPGLTPFNAQREAAAFLSMYNRAFNLSELGTGKSLASLWAYDYLRSAGIVHKVLIVSPLSTLERTWADEIFRHFPHLDYAVLHGTAEKRRKLLAQDTDVYIINHDGMEIIANDLKHRDDIDVIIVDELAQVARNSGTNRWRALNTVINRQGVPRLCWGMTGTPTPNAPTDAWAQCRLLVPETVPKYFNRFKDQVMRQVSTYNWVPRDDAVETVKGVMQPAIRFTRDECVDLPPLTYETRHVELTREQEKAYKEMLSRMMAEAEQGQILAVNEAVKMSKLVQIACIAYGTDVLTDRGWVPIQNIEDTDLVWDGEEWVSQGGAVFKGFKDVVDVNGVRMTPDHKVWVGEWVTAEEICNGNASEKLARTKVRLPDSCSKGGHNWRGVQVRDVGMPMRLRERSSSDEPVFAGTTSYTSKKLWVSPRQRNTQDDQHTAVRSVDKYEAALLESIRQGLAELRRARDHGVRTMAWVVSKLPRRYFRWLQERLDSWPNGQRRPVFAGELPLGDTNAAEQQQAQQQVYRHAERAHDSSRSSTGVRAEASYAGSKVESVSLACRAGADRTYDLVDCGPRNRFVVRGVNGCNLIVHNCGVAYSTEGTEITIPPTHRVKATLDIVEEAEGKVIVFVPFVSSVKLVADAIGERYPTRFIHGGTPKGERDDILGSFQRGKEPKVLVAQPATLSHGLTLTAASTIVWYAPITSNDIAEQANGRIQRPGQKMNTFIIELEATPVERKIYNRLRSKQKLQGLLLEEVKLGRGDLV